MNLANTAATRAPWIAAGPLVEGADLSLQLGFALVAPPEPPTAPWAAPPTAWSWTNEPRDSARHGAELAALLVILQPVESDFLNLLAEAPPPSLEDVLPLPLAPLPEPAAEPEVWMTSPPLRMPPPEWLML